MKILTIEDDPVSQEDILDAIERQDFLPESRLAFLGLHPSTLRARMHKLGILWPETNEPD